MGKVLLWLLWIVELLLFIALAGCVAIFSTVGGTRDQIAAALFYVLMIALVAAGGYGFLKAAQTLNGGGPAMRLALYLLMPVAAAFLFSGSCVVLMNP